jgi:hypothetical protein
MIGFLVNVSQPPNVGIWMKVLGDEWMSTKSDWMMDRGIRRARNDKSGAHPNHSPLTYSPLAKKNPIDSPI